MANGTDSTSALLKMVGKIARKAVALSEAVAR